jgi:hypothetical protein
LTPADAPSVRKMSDGDAGWPSRAAMKSATSFRTLMMPCESEYAPSDGIPAR